MVLMASFLIWKVQKLSVYFLIYIFMAKFHGTFHSQLRRPSHKHFLLEQWGHKTTIKIIRRCSTLRISLFSQRIQKKSRTWFALMISNRKMNYEATTWYAKYVKKMRWFRANRRPSCVDIQNMFDPWKWSKSYWVLGNAILLIVWTCILDLRWVPASN